MIKTNDLIRNKLWRVQNLYKIVNKEKQIVNLKFNVAQLIVLEDIKPFLKDKQPIRHIIIKFRQPGISTFWLIWWLDDAIFKKNTQTGILAHKKEALESLMEIILFAYNNMPEEFKPIAGTESKYALSFPLVNSKIFVSLEIRAKGLHNLHISEWCLCDDTRIRATMGATSPLTNITGESTGNGIGNDGYLTYMDAEKKENGYVSRFIPWFIQKEYQLPMMGMESLSYTPDEKKLIKMAKNDYSIGVTPEQILFRRDTKKKLRTMFNSEMPETIEDAFVTTGDLYFDGKKALALLDEAREWEKQNGYYATGDDWIQFEPFYEGDLYVAAGDTSEGARDPSVLKIINVTRRRDAFMYRARCGVDVFARVCNEWGRKFGRCLMAIERNNHGHAVLLALNDIYQYPNLYKEERITRLATGLPERKMGWLTTGNNKQLILDELKFAIEDSSDIDVEHFQPEYTVLDQQFLKELLTFRQIGVKLTADSSQYDDDIMATAICYQMYKLQRKYGDGYSILRGVLFNDKGNKR